MPAPSSVHFPHPITIYGETVTKDAVGGPVSAQATDAKHTAIPARIETQFSRRTMRFGGETVASTHRIVTPVDVSDVGLGDTVVYGSTKYLVRNVDGIAGTTWTIYADKV